MFLKLGVSKNFLLVIINLIAAVIQVQSHWWSLATSPLMNALIVGTNPMCTLETLSRNQKALCQRYQGHMQFVSNGAKTGIDECKWQFRGERWNCTTVDDSSVFGKVLKIGSQETAFTYAISAAGVVYSVARACRNEQLEDCGCSKAPRPGGLNKNWKWGGCGDNTDYAYGFAREFVDARERDNVRPRRAKDRARKTMNMHNNEAGRLIAVQASSPTCKCHGVSGSCSLKTCWMQIPSFRQIGDKLKVKYSAAVSARATKRGALRPRQSSTSPKVPHTSLVFLDSSPDYCIKHKRTGVLGTRGRECQEESGGPDGCGLLCCGRGYRTFRVEITEKCRCKFQWCCSVVCEKCPRIVERHICN